MPQSRGTRRRPTPAGRGTRSGRVPPPRKAPEAGPYGPGAYGPDDPRDPGRPEPPEIPREPRRWIRRALTSNITIMIVAIGALGAGLTAVNLGSFVGGGSKPPKAAAAGMSTNDMLAKLTSASDMDPILADSIAAAKKRAYEEHQRKLKRLREKAKKEAEARAKLKAEKEAEERRKRLARSNPSSAQNKKYGKRMNALKGWGRCWPSLLTLWNHESGWNERADNPGSDAYGIPQALPGSKMASAGSNWRTSSPTQIAWGLSYIKARYRDPCGAWSWWRAHHWY